MLFNLQSFHVLAACAGIATVLMLLSLPGIDFLLLAVAFGVSAWYTHSHRVGWPDDVAELLARVRLSAPGAAAPPTSRASSHGQPSVQPTPIVPLRAQTMPELLGGAFRIVARNWPTLVGIPLVILVACGLVAGLAMTLVSDLFMSATMSMSDSLFSGGSAGGLVASMIAMVVVMQAIAWALALPADAMLIGTTVTATDRAVRGAPVRLGEVFVAAWRQMFVLCRLTLTFYAIFLIPELLFFTVYIVTVGFGPGILLLSLLLFGVSFAIGVLFSLAPIVLVVERRGVADSLKRSMQLAKPAAGRLIGIHLLWSACAAPLLFVVFFVSMFAGVLGLLAMFVGFPVLIAVFRTLQMLIYTDLRIRAENYDRELIADWTANSSRWSRP
ncbi:hypothetical protein [Mycobacterium sp. 141]|uniref:hypothetical protein n=1 Tax=Mycobacterium sp. 141 TaxID=1120797 RepID=UPI0003A1C63C|nr:hypothetical protein [Mycobacterium sp. 141]